MAERTSLNYKQSTVLTLIEMALTLYTSFHETGKLSDMYLLFQNRDLLTHQNFTDDEIRLQHYSYYASNLSSKTFWLNWLKEYCELPIESRLYTIECANDEYSFSDNDGAKGFAQSRKQEYLEFLDNYPVETEKEVKYAETGEKADKYYANIGSKQQIEIQINDSYEIVNKDNIKHKKNQKICISMDELLKTAKAIDNSSKENYHERILVENKLLDIKSKKVVSFNVSKLTNLIGQVGSGKSTLAKVVSVNLAKKGYRVLYLENNLADVINKVDDLQKAGIEDVVAAFSMKNSSARKNKLDSINNGNEVLDQLSSDMLDFGCPLSKYVKNKNFVIDSGYEPCFGLMKSKFKYTCPLFGQCRMSKEMESIYGASIIVTTPQALCTLRIGRNREPLLRYVIKDIDLVIADEADALQNLLDQIFTYSLKANDYLKDLAELSSECMSSPLNEKSAWKQECIDNINDLSRALTAIQKRFDENRLGFSIQVLSSFTSLQLINSLKKDEEKKMRKDTISDNDFKTLWSLAMHDSPTSEIDDLMGICKAGVTNDDIIEKFGLLSKEDYSTMTDDKLEILKNKVCLIVLVIAFEKADQKLETYARDYSIPDENIKKILCQNFNYASQILPLPCAQRTMNLEYHPMSGTDPADLKITRQFVVGRSLLYGLPFLMQNVDRTVSGPNVLLMSGTSLCPGSIKNYVTLLPNYILQASPENIAYLSKIEYEFPPQSVNVSGQIDKLPKLDKLIEDNQGIILNELKTGGKILVNVNSYEQARFVGKKLNESLSDYKTKYLIRNNETEESDSLCRKNLTDFDGDILVGPTSVIGRGYNIVDNDGNSKLNTLMMFVRAMNNPDEFSEQINKLDGNIYNNFYGPEGSHADIEKCNEIRKEGYTFINKLHDEPNCIEYLSEELKKAMYVDLFITGIQQTGRISRVGERIDYKRKLKVYYLDGAFQNNKFCFKDFLISYLEELMNDEQKGNVAKALYEPFYRALKGQH